MLAVICPPAAVFLCGQFRLALLNCVLTLCLWVPGVVHALVVVRASKRDESADGIAGEMRLHRMNSVIRKV